MTLILWTAMGICLASAVVHLILWGGSRREQASLFFGLLCIAMMGSFYTDGICYQATTVEQYNRGLKLVFAFAFPVWSLFAWFCYCYGRAQSRALPITLSVILAVLFVTNLVMPLSAFTTITALRFATAPWGESFAIPVRTGSWALFLFLFAIATSLIWSGTLARRLITNRVWQEGVALSAGLLAMLAGLLFDVLRDTLSLNWIYMTEFGGTAMVLIMGGRLALDHRARKNDLEAAMARQRAIFAAADHVAFIVTDLDGKRSTIREFSPGAERIFACPSQDALGRPISDFLPPESAASFSQYCQPPINNNGAFGLELTLRRQTGDILPALLSFHTLRNAEGTTMGTLTVAIDISDRKRIEEAIVRSEADLSRAQQLAHVGSWRFDVPKAALHCTSELLRIHGYQPGTTLDATTLLDHVHPDDRQRVESLTKSVQPGTTTPLDYRIQVGGKVRWLRSRIEGLFDSDGRPTELIGTVEDATERVKLEQELLQARKMEAVGQLAGGIAHDFNNMLQAIVGSIDLAIDDLEPTHKTRALLYDAMTASHRAAELVGQLLAFSRRQILQPKDLDPNAVITGVIHMLRRLLGAHIEIRFLPGAPLGSVCADRGQLEQVLMNLFVNARDAMPDGGTLTVATTTASFDSAFCTSNPWAKPGDFVAISVTDTGIGMDAETMTRVFEPFFTTKGVGKGTGLGLATVYGVVNQHGGMVHLSSEVGKGSTFRVFLPLTTHIAATASTPVPPASKGGNETILVADDFEPIRSLTSTVLRRAGYHVLAAQDGPEALRLAEQHGTDISLAVLDLVMPGAGGLKVRNQLREQFPQMRFLFMSGFTAEGTSGVLKLEDNEHFLQKPFRKEELCKKVRSILDGGE